MVPSLAKAPAAFSDNVGTDILLPTVTQMRKTTSTTATLDSAPIAPNTVPSLREVRVPQLNGIVLENVESSTRLVSALAVREEVRAHVKINLLRDNVVENDVQVVDVEIGSLSAGVDHVGKELLETCVHQYPCRAELKM